MSSRAKLLIQGIGNPLRGDDALGPRFIELLEPGELDAEWVYQLQPEDAELWSHYERVVLIDAHVDQKDPVGFQKISVAPTTPINFSSHSLEPAVVLALCQSCFAKTPRVYLLSLKSKSFEMGHDLSSVACRSLELGQNFFRCQVAFLGEAELSRSPDALSVALHTSYVVHRPVK